MNIDFHSIRMWKWQKLSTSKRGNAAGACLRDFLRIWMEAVVFSRGKKKTTVPSEAVKSSIVFYPVVTKLLLISCREESVIRNLALCKKDVGVHLRQLRGDWKAVRPSIDPETEDVNDANYNFFSCSDPAYSLCVIESHGLLQGWQQSGKPWEIGECVKSTTIHEWKVAIRPKYKWKKRKSVELIIYFYTRKYYYT